jgi:general secretion pathway protein G
MWKRLAILAMVLLAAAAVANQVLGGADHTDRKSQQLRAQLVMLASAIEQFEKDSGALPRRLEELLAKPVDGLGPYARAKSLVDPWGAPIYYRLIPEPQRFVVFSLGEDGVLGGDVNSRDRQATGSAGR